MAKKDIKKALRDFWYGKPHSAEEGGRRLGDLHEEKTHLYKHREWRGVKDTLYYFYMIWLYNYIFMVKDVMVMGGPLNFAKGVWRYRWVGQTYLPVLHWFDRGLEGMRGEAMKASAWHYRAMVSTTIRQFQRMFAADTRLHGGKQNELYKHTIAHSVLSLGRRNHECPAGDDPVLRHLPCQQPYGSQLHRRRAVHRSAG